MPELSDVDRLLSVLEQIHEVAHTAIAADRPASSRNALLAIRSACDAEFFKWVDREETIAVVRDAAQNDLGLERAG